MSIIGDVAHIYAAITAAMVALYLHGAAHFGKFRYYLGISERERSHNFQMVSLFLGAIAMDLGSASFEVADFIHYAAVLLTCLTGTMVIGLFSYRIVTRWNT